MDRCGSAPAREAAASCLLKDASRETSILEAEKTITIASAPMSTVRRITAVRAAARRSPSATSRHSATVTAANSPWPLLG